MGESSVTIRKRNGWSATNVCGGGGIERRLISKPGQSSQLVLNIFNTFVLQKTCKLTRTNFMHESSKSFVTQICDIPCTYEKKNIIYTKPWLQDNKNRQRVPQVQSQKGFQTRTAKLLTNFLNGPPGPLDCKVNGNVIFRLFPSDSIAYTSAENY